MEGKVCIKCGVWKPLEEYNKKKVSKDGRQSKCRECQKEYNKQHYQNNKEHYKEKHKQWKENNKDKIKEYNERNNERNKDKIKQWKEDNKEREKEYKKQWYKNNPEYYKKYFKNNIERYHENDKKSREKRKEDNLQYISSILEQINPTFKQLKLPVYGYVYIFENVKTGHKYVGQTIRPLKVRYSLEGGIIKSWIEERKEYQKQKFKDELIEENFVVTETLDVAFCQYHLNKLEAYYINKYDSCNNGYNNNAGHHDTDDGLEEFQQILSTHNLEYKDGKIIKKPTSTNEID